MDRYGVGIGEEKVNIVSEENHVGCEGAGDERELSLMVTERECSSALIPHYVQLLLLYLLSLFSPAAIHTSHKHDSFARNNCKDKMIYSDKKVHCLINFLTVPIFSLQVRFFVDKA